MSDFTNPGGFLDPFDGFDKPDISQGSSPTHTWQVFKGGSMTGSGLANSLAEARTAVAAAGGAEDYAWFIYDMAGSLVDSGTVKTTDESGGGTGTTTGGDTGQAGGSTGGETGGSGQAGTISFKFTLTGYAWRWTLKTGDPRLWTGVASEPVIQTVGGYGSAQDALDAGKAIGDANDAVMKVVVVCDTAGFAGASYTYTNRWQDAINAPGKEKNAATDAYINNPNPPVIVLPPGNLLDGIPQEAVIAVIVVIVVVAIIGVVLSLGGE